MSKFAIIHGGIVVNVVTADKPFAPHWRDVSNLSVGPGDIEAGGGFIRPERRSHTKNIVTARQFRLALLDADKLAAAEAAVVAGGAEAQIEWEHSNTFKRESDFIQWLAGEAGFDADAIFEAGAGL